MVFVSGIMMIDIFEKFDFIMVLDKKVFVVFYDFCLFLLMSVCIKLWELSVYIVILVCKEEKWEMWCIEKIRDN